MKLRNPLGILALLLCSTWIPAAFADVILGTYSAFTEADWGMAFELLKDGQAVVTTEYSYEYDEKDKRVEHKKTLPGKWTFKDSTLTLTYGEFIDAFMRKTDCYEKRPCFRFKPLATSSKKKSPLNSEFEFLNWNAKVAPINKSKAK